MKKILLATTLLVSTAGFAAADVAVSGSARMGLVNGPVLQADGKTKNETYFSSRVRIVFTGSGTTDGGLTFGASTRADQFAGNANVSGASTQTTNGDSTVYISGEFGKLTFGDTAGGATDHLVGQISYVGFTSLGSYNEIGRLPGTATAARYDYTSGNISVSIGASQPTAPNGSDKNSIAVKYATDMYNAAIGYETVTGAHEVEAKGGVTFGAATVTAKIAKNSLVNKVQYGVSLDYKVSPALKLTAFYTDHQSAGLKAKGIGASYDLGGGASVLGGVVDTGAATNNIMADVGVTMSF